MLFAMRRPAFTLIEVLLVVAILAILSAISVTTYRSYQVHSDLVTATEQVTQAVGRAKFLSESGMSGATWGFSITNGTLFQGNSYATRAPSYDELYPMPVSVTASGLTEVAFSPLKGIPTQTGTIVLTSLLGEQQSVTINIDQHGIVTNTSDKLTICHCPSSPPKTLQIPDSAWPAHQGHGDYLGACTVPETHCNQ